MNSFRDVIDAFGGIEKFRASVGVEKYPTAAGWYRRDSIPSGWWHSVVSAAQREGLLEVDFASMAEMASNKQQAAE